MIGRRSYKYYSAIQFLILIAILIFINIISTAVYQRIDLTKEKRFTLSDPTKQMLSNLDDVVFVKVYLEGEFPAGFKRLRNSVKDMLNEFHTLAGGNLVYEFIDPNESKDASEKKQIMTHLINKGLNPVNLKVEGGEEYSEKIIFPGAIASYKGRELPISFLATQVGIGPQQALNNSISLLEYKIANTISKLGQPNKKKLAFIKGHGELSKNELIDISNKLSEFYEVETINLPKHLVIPKDIDVIIMAKPQFPVDERDKYKIDQYIMNGGKIIWLIETLKAELDSLRGSKAFIAINNPINLQDQLFSYGARINPNLVQDLQCNPIPMVVGQMGDAPQTKLYPWFYYPILTSRSTHPIVKNLDMVMTQFISSIDTVGAKGIKKTILLTTSAYCKASYAPVRVSLSLARFEPKKEYFKKSYLPVVVLLEGRFKSVFKNRLSPATLKMIDTLQKVSSLEISQPTKMVVISDGDIIRNEVSSKGMKFPMGYYQYSNQTFANKDLILNIVEYLCDNSGLIETRGKEVKLRMLDRAKIKSEKIKWQSINLGVPFILLLTFGLLYNFIRKYRFTHQ